ncbi:hypothetical protein PV367_44950 [Streptomyces europaeiscabiei]|uniref:Uncharacterized protein n=1 Tax=Streptomyces europaeiscabiei TaxID=146819 RepID=A0AAJ2Q131_9ACTN|nr:hypothetical protein [Streptomyces europaeiscabiei]MDX3136787.1 hypothetical protein [Streptomyces europaeiscabiei]
MELGVLSLSDLQTDPATGTQIRLLRPAIPPGTRDRPAARRAETVIDSSVVTTCRCQPVTTAYRQPAAARPARRSGPRPPP